MGGIAAAGMPQKKPGFSSQMWLQLCFQVKRLSQESHDSYSLVLQEYKNEQLDQIANKITIPISIKFVGRALAISSFI